MSDFVFTSESVSEGHPDKVCDQISDRLLDLALYKDKNARVAIETLVTTNRVVLSGEVSSLYPFKWEEIEQTVRGAIRHIGYEQEGFDWQTVQIDNYIHEQSEDIALGVDKDGAGDQGLMFGYATNEMAGTEYMPAAVFYAHRILQNLSAKRHKKEFEGIQPDAKSQVGLLYRDGKPIAIDHIVVSTQHDEDLSVDEVEKMVRQVLLEELPNNLPYDEKRLFVNPTGRFVIGGPVGDTGLTGRKIIVDTYGGAAPHGGGAFSGKDPTKVDRSAAYMARYVAKNIVAAGLADRCLIGLSYAIGVAYPLSVLVNTYGTGKISDDVLTKFIKDNIDLTPKGIRKGLNLCRPIYTPTAAYGHFGRKPTEDGLFTWEQTNLVDLFSKI